MSALHAQLHALAAHVRDPAAHPGPAGIPERRLQVYRELVRNNLDALLGSTFPVLRDTLGQAGWNALRDRFLAVHRSQTPLFPRLGLEFVAFLAHAEDPARPWLAELADYEWAELGLQLAEAAAPPHDCAADLLEGIPRLSPLAWPRAYRWPVHRIGPGFQPAVPPAQPTLLLLRRDAGGRVHFSQLSPLLYRLLELADGNTARSGRTLLRQLAEEAGQHDSAAFLCEALPMLARLREEGVLAWRAAAG
ncbi:MAG: putative DNA-binding domain-containing protein [Stenotrophomonas sp.]|nr:putative DNA-binding domain-containing protein [Xanthomonadales bacterium]MBN8768035.1 putative DNA-binding domain-containing protein [Stenotrophomonas sp.]